jgi:hypothetical protein
MGRIYWLGEYKCHQAEEGVVLQSELDFIQLI